METSTAAMAEDLIEKTRIIEHYVMESRTGRIQLKISFNFKPYNAGFYFMTEPAKGFLL